MFLIYLALGSFGFIIALFIGLKLSETITHPIMFLLFWILYLITILSILNVISSGIFFMVLRYKKGPPGISGEMGPVGEKGDPARCEETCKEDLCQKIILDKLTYEFNNLINKHDRKESTRPLIINNSFVKETIKRMCHSPQFKEVSRIKDSSQILEYLGQIWIIWINLLFDADSSSDKSRFKTWLETHGADNEWEAISINKTNPFDEIKKYDVYYWGLPNEFKPVKVANCLSKEKEYKGSNAKIPSIESNIYEWIYNDRGTGAKQDLEIWRAKPIKYQNRTYYPLGDVAIGKYGGEHAERHFKEFGTQKSEITSIDVSNKEGLLNTTVLVDGSSPYVAIPEKYDMMWNDRGSGGKHDTVFWMPQNFTKDGKKFKCFGGIAGKDTYKNPFEIYGRDENHPIRCIEESCLEQIPQVGTRIWRDRGSGAKLDGSVWTNKHPSFKPYNVVYFPNRTYNDTKRDFYKIKEECLRDSRIEEENDNLNNLDNKEEISYGWHGTPKRSSQYSIFNFLDLVVESKIVNSNTNEIYYLAHTGAETPNSYFVKPINKETDTISNCLKIKGSVLDDTGTCDINNDNEVFQVEFSIFNPNIFFLKSKSRGTYLYLEKSDKTNNKSYYLRNKDIPNAIKNDKNKSQPYQWYFYDKPINQ